MAWKAYLNKGSFCLFVKSQGDHLDLAFRVGLGGN